MASLVELVSPIVNLLLYLYTYIYITRRSYCEVKNVAEIAVLELLFP